MNRYPTERFWADTKLSKLEQEVITVLKASTMGVTGNSYVIEAQAVAKLVKEKMREAWQDAAHSEATGFGSETFEEYYANHYA